MENAPPEKPKRGRGRPPGTKNSKKPSLGPPPPSTHNVAKDPSESIRAPTRVDTAVTRDIDICYIPGFSRPVGNVETEAAVQNLPNTFLNPALVDSYQSSSPGMQNFHQSKEELRSLKTSTSLQNAIQPQPQDQNMGTTNQISPSPQFLYLPESDFSHVLHFISLLRELTSDQPHLYLAFLELMDQFRNKEIDSSTLANEINTLFAAYPILLAWFNTYGSKTEAKKAKDAMNEEENRNDTIIFLSPATNNTETIEVSECPEHSIESPGSMSQQENELSVGTDAPLPIDTELGKSQQNNGTNSVVVNTLKPEDVYEAKSLNDMACLAVSFHELMKIMCNEEPQKYTSVRNALSELHEPDKNMSSSHDSNHPSEASSSSRRQRVLQKIYELLGDKPELLELCKAFFTSENNFLGLPTIRPGTYLTSHNVTEEPEKEVEPKSSESSAQPDLPVPSNEPTPNNVADTTPEIIILCEMPSQGTLTSNLTNSQELSDLPHAVETEQQIESTNEFSEINEPTEADMQLRRFMRSQFNDEKWIIELVNALSPILMKMGNLRSYVKTNLRAVLLKRDNLQDNHEMTASEFPQSPDICMAFQCDADSADDDTDMEASGSYKVHLDTASLPKCSGRTELCNEVLNDTYFSTSARSKFKLHVRSDEEKRFDDYEDARYEVDIMLHRNASAVGVFEDLHLQMSEMTEEELEDFRLEDNLGGSSVLHRKAVQLHFGEDVINELQKCPSVYLPSVILMLRIHDKELIELRARWNSLISADLRRVVDRYNRRKKIQGFIRLTPERQETSSQK